MNVSHYYLLVSVTQYFYHIAHVTKVRHALKVRVDPGARRSQVEFLLECARMTYFNYTVCLNIILVLQENALKLHVFGEGSMCCYF